MKSRFVFVAVAAAAIVGISADASAQGVMTAMVSGAVYDSLSEKECQAGHPVPKDVWDKDAAAIDQQVSAYATAAAERGPQGLRKLLGGGNKPVWKWTGGPVAVAHIQDPFAGGAAAAVTRVTLVIGDDNASARGIWRFERSDPSGAAPTLVYAYTIDFTTSSWSGAWKMRRVSLSSVDQAPTLPTRFCHLGEAPSLL